MENWLHLWDTLSLLLEDINFYQRMLGKLIYLIVYEVIFLVSSCSNPIESSWRELYKL